jgi:transposase
MSGRDLRRWRVIEDVLLKRRLQEDASEELGLSVRQIRRLVKRARVNGVQGLIHGLRGRPGNRAMPEPLKQRVLELWQSKYRSARLNFSHFTEKLNEVEGVEIGREKVRQILRAEGVADRVIKKGRKHRRYRERKAQFGELLQQDTSPHDWLGVGRRLQLIVIVDDATSKLLFCRLFEHDGTMPNMMAMRSVFLKHGLPMSIYADRASWFFYTPKEKISAGPKKANGEVDRAIKTQIDRALGELGVEFIPAYSPQAKGRVERANGTLQDRLIAEFKLRGIMDIETANRFIEEKFIDDYNKRFGREPQEATSAFVPLQEPESLNEILCLKFLCKVAKDNTARRAKHFHIQLEPSPHRINWHKALVEVRLYHDGSVRVVHPSTGQDVPFKVIDLKEPREAKHPSELPDPVKIPA